MIDSYVWLTPLLMLPIVALLAFVGCHWVFGLDRVEATKPIVSAEVVRTGYARIDLAWPADANAGKFQVTRKDAASGYVLLAELLGNAVSYPDYDVERSTTYTYVVTAVGGEDGPYPSDEVSVRMPDTWVTAKTLGTPRNAFTAWLGIAIQVGATPLTITGLGRAFAPGNNGIHILKIVTAAGADVPGSRVAVTMADETVEGKVGEFRYAPLDGAGITLTSGATYYVVSEEIMGQDMFYDNDTKVLVTNVGNATASIFGTGASYITDGPAGQTYGPVDFRY